MIHVYTDKKILMANNLEYRNTTYPYFKNRVFYNLDFELYDIIFRNIEKYKWIDYEHHELENEFGRCTFLSLSNGMKNLFNYIYMCKNRKRSNYECVFDLSNMGPNVQQYLFRFADYYEVPYYMYTNETTILNNLTEINNPYDIEDLTIRDILTKPVDDYKFTLNGCGEYNALEFFIAYKKAIIEDLKKRGIPCYDI